MGKTREKNRSNFEACVDFTALKRGKNKKKNKCIEEQNLRNLQQKTITTQNIPMAVLYWALKWLPERKADS
jgi:hypothetical protein